MPHRFKQFTYSSITRMATQSTRHETTIKLASGDSLNIEIASWRPDSITAVCSKTGDEFKIELASSELQKAFLSTVSNLSYSYSESRKAFLSELQTTLTNVVKRIKEKEEEAAKANG